MTSKPPNNFKASSGALTTITQCGLQGQCPQCRSRTLFSGLIAFAPKCNQCGLDFEQFNVGDGAAAFLIMIIGALVVVGAAMLEVIASPPFWVHIVIWVPVVIGLTLLTLRLTKAALLASEYMNAAHEGRIVK